MRELNKFRNHNKFLNNELIEFRELLGYLVFLNIEDEK